MQFMRYLLISSILCLIFLAQICYAKPNGGDQLPIPTTVENTPDVNVVSLPAGAIPVVVENLGSEKIPVEIFAPKKEAVRQRTLLMVGTSQIVGTDQIYEVPDGYDFVLKVVTFDATIDAEPMLNFALLRVVDSLNEPVFYNTGDVKTSARTVYGSFDQTVYLKSGDKLSFTWAIPGETSRTSDMIIRIGLSGYLTPE